MAQCMSKRNLFILVVCQLISGTGSIVLVSLGGIIGAKLADNPAWSTLPVSLMVISVALTTVPAAMLMRRIGRSRGFALASLSAVVAVLVAAQALAQESFGLFVLATMLFGINLAFTHQYRYAAAESVAPRFTARAISFVLLGAIGGAFVGREIAMRGQDWLAGVPYAGSMYALAVLYVVQALLFLQLSGIESAEDRDEPPSDRPLGDIVRQRTFLVAVLGSTAGYGLMTLVMTATPISMHINDGHSLEQTTGVIRAHVLGMYVPSLVTGFLIERIGVARMMLAGAVTLLGTTLIGLQGQSVLHYWWALVLLGVGWNFLYVGGTTMLTYTYSMEERFRAQAVNEFLVFGTAATASLLAGTVMHYFGWLRLMLIPIPILAFVCLALLVVRRDSLLQRTQNT
jgi:predicted MFS family arabinose efflux permease